MSLLGFRAQTHPQQGPRSVVDDRATDPLFFGTLHARFHFTLDVAATAANAKCERFFSPDDDGLILDPEPLRIELGEPT